MSPLLSELDALTLRIRRQMEKRLPEAMRKRGVVPVIEGEDPRLSAHMEAMAGAVAHEVLTLTNQIRQIESNTEHRSISSGEESEENPVSIIRVRRGFESIYLDAVGIESVAPLGPRSQMGSVIVMGSGARHDVEHTTAEVVVAWAEALGIDPAGLTEDEEATPGPTVQEG